MMKLFLKNHSILFTMRKFLISIFILTCFFVNMGIAQTFNIDLRNFEQVNETEFTFEAFIQNESGTPFTLFSYQFQLDFDQSIRNGGIFDNSNLTVEGESELTGVNQPLSTGFTSIAANRLQFVSEQYLGSNVEATYLDDATEYKIDKFRVKLTSSGDLHNFADVAPGWKFNLTGTLVAKALNVAPNNTTITGPGLTAVTRNKPATAYDHGLGVRQMAGYCFTGDGNWDVLARWNNLTVANSNTLPGLNSNAIINGNVTIPVGYDVSLLPDVTKAGNGGELTVLTGAAPPVYQLNVAHAFGVNGDAYIVGGLYDGLTEGFFAENETVTVYAEFAFPLAIGFTSVPAGVVFDPVSAVQTITSEFSMPGNDVIVSAGFAKSSNESPIIENHFKSGKSLLASLTIVPGASLTVDKLFNDSSNGAEAIIVMSNEDGTGYLIHNNEGVLATVERYLSQGKYHYVSSPILDAPYALFQVSPAPIEPDFADFFMWVEDYPEPDGPSWVNLNYPYNNPPVGTLTPGRGYAVAYSDAAHTKEFVGEVNVGDIIYSGTYTPKEDGPPYWNNRGFNLVGNPYPAALDAEEFLQANIQANSSIYGLYFWDEGDNYEGDRNDDYATYSLAGGVGTASTTVQGSSGVVPNGFIAPGQGFMAQVIATPMNANAAVDILFSNDMRITDETHFYKKSSDKDRIWLSVTGPEGDYNQILVAFMEGALEGHDISDAQKIRGNSNLAFYSIMEGADFAIQGFPVLNATDTYEIPLGLHAGFAGNYTFRVDEIENFAPNTDITFEDRLAGQIINLRTTSEFTVHVANKGDLRDRFYLHFNGPTSVAEVHQHLTKVYALNNQIHLQHIGSSEILHVEVINTLGQTMISTPVNAMEAVINVPGRNVVYIVKVRTSEGVESHKLLMR